MKNDRPITHPKGSGIFLWIFKDFLDFGVFREFLGFFPNKRCRGFIFSESFTPLFVPVVNKDDPEEMKRLKEQEAREEEEERLRVEKEEKERERKRKEEEKKRKQREEEERIKRERIGEVFLFISNNS